jgi:hypothetical protein
MPSGLVKGEQLVIIDCDPLTNPSCWAWYFWAALLRCNDDSHNAYVFVMGLVLCVYITDSHNTLGIVRSLFATQINLSLLG